MRKPSMRRSCRRRPAKAAKDARLPPARPRSSRPRYCSIAPAFHPARSTARAGRTIKRLSPRFRTQTESRLNPKASFETADTKIMVPNVAKKPSEAKVAKVVVDKSQRTVRALDGGGKLISFYPASVGSEERPAPSGTLSIRSVVENPTYHYTPKLKFKGVKTQKPFTVAAGPKN